MLIESYQKMKKLLKKIISNQNNKKDQPDNPFVSFENISRDKISAENPIFITGVGRSGTHFLAQLFNSSDKINAYHLDHVGNSIADSFLFYCKWYGISVDLSGFYVSRNFLIYKSKNNKSRYVESNPYLALSTKDLKNYYPNAKIIIVWRDPRKVVLSHLNKGWYSNYEPAFQDWGKAPFYQYQLKQANHFFGRFFPINKSEFEDWSKMTQVGKIAWMWQSINNHIKKDINTLPEGSYKIVNIEDYNYEKYIDINEFLAISDSINKDLFNNLVNIKPGKSTNKTKKRWNSNEEKEFQLQINKFNGF